MKFYSESKENVLKELGVNRDNDEELLRYDLGEDFSIETAVVVWEIYKNNGEWKFSAVGAGFEGGLEALCKQYGLNV